MKVAIVIAPRTSRSCLYCLWPERAASVSAAAAGNVGRCGRLFHAYLFTHHFTTVIFTVQVVGGILLLIGRYVPLTLTLFRASDRQYPDVPCPPVAVGRSSSHPGDRAGVVPDLDLPAVVSGAVRCGTGDGVRQGTVPIPHCFKSQNRHAY